MQETNFNNIQEKKKRIRIGFFIVLVLLAIWKIFFSDNNIKIEAVQSNLDTVLADHSHIILKKGSVLTYTKDFNKDDRTVTLFGEALCEITGDNKHPFIVEGGAAKASTFSGNFDVKSDSVFAIVNTKGTIIVNTKNKEKLTLNIAEGEKVFVNAQHTSKELSRSDNYLFWKTGEMVFISKPLETVVAEMNLYADAHLSISDKASDNLRQTIVNISFRNQSLDEMVKELCTIASVKSVKKDGGWILKGRR